MEDRSAASGLTAVAADSIPGATVPEDGTDWEPLAAHQTDSAIFAHSSSEYCRWSAVSPGFDFVIYLSCFAYCYGGMSASNFAWC